MTLGDNIIETVAQMRRGQTIRIVKRLATIQGQEDGSRFDSTLVAAKEPYWFSANNRNGMLK